MICPFPSKSLVYLILLRRVGSERFSGMRIVQYLLPSTSTSTLVPVPSTLRNRNLPEYHTRRLLGLATYIIEIMVFYTILHCSEGHHSHSTRTGITPEERNE
jgi:hypothetical protein